MGKTKQVIGYVRVSTEGQTDGFGLEAQRRAIDKYCMDRGYHIIKWVEDVDSGAKFRKGFDDIVFGSVENPPYEAVVVAKSDRVARDIYVYFYYKGALKRKNIELFSATEDFGALGAYAHILEVFTQVCAEIERDNIARRMAAGREVKAAKGGYAGGRPPLGYRAVKGKGLVVDENEADIVRAIFRLHEAGYSLGGIANKVNEHYVTRTGNLLHRTSVMRILSYEPFYRGLYKYGNDEWHKGDHVPILNPYEDYVYARDPDKYAE